MKLASDTLESTNIRSHPSRGAWIEIAPLDEFMDMKDVAPLAGCVD